MKNTLIIFALILLITHGFSQSRKKIDDLLGGSKFGMFIHWGPYAEFAGSYNNERQGGNAEWIMLSAKIPSSEYEQVCKQWNPSDFNADEWISLAKEAGMKYIVFTTKHHDGFCMFHSELTNYNLVDFSPFGRDVTKELADACRKYGIELGLYYSLVDWHHSEFPAKYSNLGSNFHGNPNPNADISKYADYQLGQIDELMRNYGPVFVTWFDGGGSFKNADRYSLLKGDSIVSLIRSLQPNCLINDRIGGGKGDYGTPEQSVPGTIQQQAFETCMTINDTWGYSKYDNNWKSVKDLLSKLVDITHKGGNFLLNVGPDGNGKIPEESVARLKEMGKWLNLYGESVYGTKNSLFNDLEWGKSSTKILPDGNSAIYLFVEEWVSNSKLDLTGLINKVKTVTLLSPKGDIPLKYNQRQELLTIKLPKTAPDEFINVIRLNLEGLPKVNYKNNPNGNPEEDKHSDRLSAITTGETQTYN